MDWTYNFLQDTEPSDLQLEMLMHEVADEARTRRKKADENYKRLINKEIKLAAERGKSLIKNDF
ncbi:hypothetical protein FACS189421_05160 [Bacteroidia bacterium]|nr:hypothetical protein FACS189421_05160 [Bacteroidia bacterium]GHT47262.1 hypothetical protein FACS189440_07230 [Bacteroidia bacterium]